MGSSDGLRPRKADPMPKHADFALTAVKVPGEEIRRSAPDKQKKPGKI
jgi:hypothetical protein